MNRRTAVIAAAVAMAAGGAFALAPSAQAAGEFCYDIDVVVNGESVVDEAACEVLGDVPLPELPAPPALPDPGV